MTKFYTLAVALTTLFCGFANNHTNDNVTPQEVLTTLLEGNKRFVVGTTTTLHEDMKHVKELVQGQHPHAAIIACSDSRVPVELLFDQGFGDLFVIRTAGNTLIDNITIGSADYAVNHLGVKVIMVLGHTSCGAITSVVQMGHSHHHIEHDHEVESMIDHIAQFIEKHRGTNKNIDQAVIDNTNKQVEIFTSRPFIKEKIESKKLIVVPAIYDISCGTVRIL